MADLIPDMPREPGSLAWRRRQMLIVWGAVLVVGGLAVYVAAHWGSVCVDDSCWGDAAGSAWHTGWAGVAVAVLGLCLLITGFAVPAPAQVTLVPGGEVNLSGTRVLVTGGAGPGAALMLVGADEVTCRQGEQVTVGDDRYDVQAVDASSHWVTLCPVPEDSPEGG